MPSQTPPLTQLSTMRTGNSVSASYPETHRLDLHHKSQEIMSPTQVDVRMTRAGVSRTKVRLDRRDGVDGDNPIPFAQEGR